MIICYATMSEKNLTTYISHANLWCRYGMSKIIYYWRSLCHNDWHSVHIQNTQFESNTHGRNAGSAGAELRGMNINEYIGYLQVLFYNGNDDPAARLDDYVRPEPTDASQTALAQPGHCPVNDIRKGNIETCAKSVVAVKPHVVVVKQSSQSFNLMHVSSQLSFHISIRIHKSITSVCFHKILSYKVETL